MDRAIGMYRKHPNYTYGRNLKMSPSNQATVALLFASSLVPHPC